MLELYQNLNNVVVAYINASKRSRQKGHVEPDQTVLFCLDLSVQKFRIITVIRLSHEKRDLSHSSRLILHKLGIYLPHFFYKIGYSNFHLGKTWWFSNWVFSVNWFHMKFIPSILARWIMWWLTHLLHTLTMCKSISTVMILSFRTDRSGQMVQT